MNMNCLLMGSSKLYLPHLGLSQKPPKPHHFHFSSMVPLSCSTPNIICGLRGRPRKPLWRKSVMSTEAIQAIQSLKFAKSSPKKLDEVFNGRITRLLKSDLLDALAELQRQNELDLALKVFKFVREEVWYKPDLTLYCDMIRLLGKNKLIEMAEELFLELKKDGLEPDTRAFTEMIGAYFRLGLVGKAIEMYELMKASGCNPDELTFTILIRSLKKVGEEELVGAIKKECEEYMDSPEKFLEEVEQKKPKSRMLSLVKLNRNFGSKPYMSN